MPRNEAAMVTAISTWPTHRDSAEAPAPRASLADLAALGSDRLTADLQRALPDADGGQASSLTFNSSV
ncbi:hypothetical protein ACIRBX_32005 [Kitasatospora sp. NPDC096147]|uniref:hypothetical protein n=1 Tax=Kitasatospora sp. NPDC096147 TaxID=3364093 RepID=UPI00381148FC